MKQDNVYTSKTGSQLARFDKNSVGWVDTEDGKPRAMVIKTRATDGMQKWLDAEALEDMREQRLRRSREMNGKKSVNLRLMRPRGFMHRTSDLLLERACQAERVMA